MEKMIQQAGSTNRYRIISKLCSGGMADIYLGIQLDQKVLDRLVVIKKVHGVADADRESMMMFADEARIISTLNHPHIVQIYDFTEEDDTFHIVMEYIDGENLGFILNDMRKRKQKVPLPIVFRLMEQVLEALQYIHGATSRSGEPLNIIHRDLDPRNLMMDTNGYLKIIDFGVAKAVVQTEMTAPGLFKGKLSHVAPEIFTKSDIDHRADLYSIGLVLFELISGKRPYRFGKSPVLMDAIKQITEEPIPKPSEFHPKIHPDLEAIILKACHKNREERFQTAFDLHDALLSFASSASIPIASNSEVKQWFNTQFERQLETRRSFEMGTLQRAQQVIAELASHPAYGSSIFEVPRRGFTTSSGTEYPPGCRITGPDTGSGLSFASGSMGRGSSHQYAAPPPRMTASAPPADPFNMNEHSEARNTGTKRYFLKVAGITAAISAALFVSLFFVLHEGEDNAAPQIASSETPSVPSETKTNDIRMAPSEEKHPDPPPEPKEEKLSTEIEDESIVIAANRPSSKSRPAPSPRRSSWKWSRSREKAHPESSTQQASASSEDEGPLEHKEAVDTSPVKQKIDVDIFDDDENDKSPETAPVKKSTLSKPVNVATPANTITPTPRPSALVPTPEASVQSARTDASSRWLSGHGNWDGSTALAKGCKSCHKTLTATDKTSSQWEYFFSHNRHRRNGDLRKLFSKKELSKVQSHLISRSNQARKKNSGIAGIR